MFSMTGLAKKKELKLRQLRWSCPQHLFHAKDSSKMKPLTQIIGQERALKAIKLGLEVKGPGYNIYVAGLQGTGRKSTIKRVLEQIETRGARPNDICYVFNFHNPESPLALYLPGGKGRELKDDIEQAIGDVVQAIPLIFESEHFRLRVRQALKRTTEKTRQIISEFDKKVQAAGFAIVNVETPTGESHPQLFPAQNGNVVNWEQLYTEVQQGKRSEADLQMLQKAHGELSEELHKNLAIVRKINRESEKIVFDLKVKAIEPYLSVIINDLKKRYSYEKVQKYLDDLKADILATFDTFRKPEEKQDASADALYRDSTQADDPLLRYQVNVIVDNAARDRPPVVIENFPSYKNLFGMIERVVEKSGVWYTDFTKIRAGSLVRANGGYLVINLSDALMEPGVWTVLKRTLKNNLVDIQSHEPDHVMTTSSMKPEPISIDVKVIIIGDAYYYYRLSSVDDDFKKIFKIRADFDTTMPLTDETIRNYGHFIARLCKEEKLFPFDRSAMAGVVEYGVRLAEDVGKISTKFSEIADLLREADFWARSDSARLVKVAHVDKAIAEKRYRSNLVEEKIKKSIADGRILIDTTGRKVGQINGLTVWQNSDYSFGRPSRITCQVGAGQSGVISIDREADLSGKSHRKGIAIISGYLRGKYAKKRPINVSLSLTFEQLMGYIDGDSASSTEVYAILSALSGVPLRQDIAVTGSVSQRGEIQPIGGVNEKIEGFFDICRARGLTGQQGVLIPVQNVKNLMLRKDVVEAVRRRSFHIYAIETVDEGIELLTGIPAARLDREGKHTLRSIHGKVEKRLREFAESAKSGDAKSGRNSKTGLKSSRSTGKRRTRKR